MGLTPYYGPKSDSIQRQRNPHSGAPPPNRRIDVYCPAGVVHCNGHQQQSETVPPATGGGGVDFETAAIVRDGDLDAW